MWMDYYFVWSVKRCCENCTPRVENAQFCPRNPRKLEPSIISKLTPDAAI